MRIFTLSALFFLMPIQSALAHHPWEGQTLDRWYQGLLSGFAHPLAGFDHLAFLLATGILCAFIPAGKPAAAAFVPATILGVLARQFLPLEIPFYETALGLSVAAVGTAVFRAKISAASAAAFAALFGAFHGFAYGEAIAGAGASPLVFYLFGLAVVQTAFIAAVAAASAKIARICSEVPSVKNRSPLKAAGAILFAAGAAMAVQSAASVL